MNWDRLRVFIAVNEAGSFTRAGRALGLSQSAVSRQMIALEEKLGASLFHRHARGPVLTEPGEDFHRSARNPARNPAPPWRPARARAPGQQRLRHLPRRRERPRRRRSSTSGV